MHLNQIKERLLYAYIEPVVDGVAPFVIDTAKTYLIA
jgi:hypothetical protein